MVETAEAGGQRVLRAQPSEQERTLAYVAISDLAGSVFDDARGSLPPPQERALAAALLRDDTGAPPDPRATATAFVNLLSLVAAEKPTVVAIDDAQWLAPASARVLTFAARRLPPRVGLVLATRPGEGALPLGLERARPDVHLTHLVVGPLTLAALHHVVASRLGTVFKRSTLVRLASTSGGNPFLALELGRALARDGDDRPFEPLKAPETLHQLVAGRVEALTPDARAAVCIASALPRPTLARVAGALPRGVDPPHAIGEAVRAGVLQTDGDDIRFSHPLLASVVYGSMSELDRRHLHATLAEIVDDGDLEGRGRHLALAATEPDARVADELERAAEQAARRGAPESASDLYDAASRLTPVDLHDALARRLLGAAESTSVEGRSRARSLAERAVRLATLPTLQVRALRALGTLAWHDGSAREGIEHLERARDVAADDPALRAAVTADLVRFNFSLDFERALELADEAVSLLSEETESAPLASVLIDQHFASAVTGRGARPVSLARALALEETALRNGSTTPQPMPIIWYHCTDELEAARSRYAMEVAWAEERGATEHFDRKSHLALAELRAGNWDLAEQLIEESCAALEGMSVRGPLRMPLEKRSLIDAHRGRIDQARATLHSLIEEFQREGQRWWAALSLSSLAFTEYAAGDAPAADGALERMRDHAEAVGGKDILFDRSEPFHVEILLARAQRVRAGEALERLEERGRTLPRPWITAALPRTRALLLAADGDLAAALEEVEALDATVASRLPFELACTRLVEGRLERRAKRKRAAADALGEALGLFESLGAAPFAARARAELARVGLRRAPDDLTITERRIAELAAVGMTNREVARTAFVSPKTVEANLTRVYRKLGIRSRAELGAWLVRTEGSGRQKGDAERQG